MGAAAALALAPDDDRSSTRDSSKGVKGPPADASVAAAAAAAGWRAYLTTCLWVVTWIVLSVSIIIVNKHVITYSGFSFPITLALWHMLLGTLTARGAVLALGLRDTIREHGGRALYTQVGLIGALFAGTLVCGNAALQHLTVPTVQMLKASGPATIYVMGILMGSEQLSLGRSLKVLVVCTGVGIASYGDLTLSAIGFTLQVASIMMDATRCCSLQRVLQANHIDVTPIVTLAHVAPFAAAALLLPAAALEGPRLLGDYDKWRAAIPMVLLSGALASALNLVVFKIIRLTSALTTSLTGVLKEWACILVAMEVYGTLVTRLQWLGYSIAISGLLWYQSDRIRSDRVRAAAQAKQAACPSPVNHAKGDRDEGDCLVHIHAADGRCSSGGGDDDGAFGARVVSATGGSRGSHCGTMPLLRVMKLPG